MLNKTKLIFFLFFLFGLCFLFPTPTKAGVYTCRYILTEGKCVVNSDDCGNNLKENCSQFDGNIGACQGSEYSDCIPDVEPPASPPPPGSCATGTCTTDSDCGGPTCRGATSVACTGICDCPASRCNGPLDCAGLLATCLNITQGQWCSGTCNFSEEDPPPFPPPSDIVRGDCDAGTITVWTAIGCIPYDIISNGVAFFLSWGLGLAGGVAFLAMIVAAFQLMTSAGDPAKLSSGKELLMSAVSGIILLVFSMFLLRFVGVNVLGLF